MLASRIRMATFKDSSSIPNGYVLATDSDFMFVEQPGAPNTYSGVNGFHMYVGTKPKIVIPNEINGNTLLDYAAMFMENNVVTGVANLPNNNVTNMFIMFQSSQTTTLDLSNLDTSNVTNMYSMFGNSKATSLDLSNFNTSKVTDMMGMFADSRVITLDLSSFNTSNVITMEAMFFNSQTAVLDLSSFDISNVTSMFGMFNGSQAITGYARTQADANKFNASGIKPAGLTFIVKP